MICSEDFYELADSQRAALGLPDLKVVQVAHPIGDQPAPNIEARGRAAAAGVLGGLLRAPKVS